MNVLLSFITSGLNSKLSRHPLTIVGSKGDVRASAARLLLLAEFERKMQFPETADVQLSSIIAESLLPLVELFYILINKNNFYTNIMISLLDFCFLGLSAAVFFFVHFYFHVFILRYSMTSFPYSPFEYRFGLCFILSSFVE